MVGGPFAVAPEESPSLAEISGTRGLETLYVHEMDAENDVETNKEIRLLLFDGTVPLNSNFKLKWL